MATEVHWAGVASLRYQAGREVDGFAELALETDNLHLAAWGGHFYASNQPLPPEGAAVEVLFPNGIVGRAVMGAAEPGGTVLGGVTPFPQWDALLETVGDDGVSIVEHDGYLEARAGSAITPANWVPVESFGLQPGQRMLIDYRPVRQILVPLSVYLSAAETLDALGLKVAVVATSPIAFGISRQTILTAGLDEERAFRVFRDYSEAVAWLTGAPR